MDAYTSVRMDWLRTDTVSVPSCFQTGDRESDASAESTRQAPTRIVDRHTTGPDVLLGENCTNTAPECSTRRWRDLANGTMNGPPGASRTNGSRTPSTILPIRHLCFSGLALNGFTYSWTLSSKFFSTLPHGTCSLSVSWSYLALDGVHNPLRAALSSNPTLRRDPSEMRNGRYGPGTLCG